MADPQTVNILLAVPTRGSDVGTWDTPLNGDMSSLDGHLGGLATVGLSSGNVTLTKPAGTVTPGAGPTQAENAVVRLTGTLTANVQVTLPLPGPLIIENLTTGNFTVTLAAVASGEIIATQQGTRTSVYNDGTNVRFVDLGKPGDMEFWAGLTTIPAWVTACTVKPFLLCDSSVYNFTDYPYLGPRMGSAFGGNGITTFGVPGLGGRVPLAYDYTGTRVTTAGSGLNGQTMGAAIDTQNKTLLTTNLPPYTPAGSVTSTPSLSGTSNQKGSADGSAFNCYAPLAGTPAPIPITGSVASTFTGTPQGGTSTPFGVVQPSQVAGIWVIKT